VPAREEITPIVLSCEVDPYHDGWTLLDYLGDRFRYLDRGEWVNRIESGRVRVNGIQGAGPLTVRAGDAIEYEVHVVEPPVDFGYTVVFDDGDLLVVSKSGNIPVHAGGKYFRHTLVAKLREDGGLRLDLAHRLDRETSGLTVLTKNVDAARGMARAFSRGAVAKTYLAVVRGEPAAGDFSVDEPIGKIGESFPVARSVIDREAGKPARTDFRVIERLRGAALLEARPSTGRKHQIRVHLEFAGHPVIGDKIYGMPIEILEESLDLPDSARVREHLLLPRHALHAWRLSFPHPRTGRPVLLEAPIPQDILGFIAARR
jgi:23S rRNA pseudouridine1911/1915/1917 synthase